MSKESRRLLACLATLLLSLSAGLALRALVAPVAAAPADISLLVNMAADGSDLNPGDGICDVSAEPNAQCSLRAAIEEANALAGRQTITFTAGFHHLLTLGALVIADDLDVEGVPGFLLPLTVVDANYQTRNVEIEPGVAVRLQNVEIVDGVLDGAGIYNSGELTLAYVLFYNNESYQRGGAIYNLGSLTVESASFAGNRARYAGGAIYNGSSADDPDAGGRVIVESASFTDNLVSCSSPIRPAHASNLVEIDEGGAAIYNEGLLDVRSATFSGNRYCFGAAGGGAIANDDGGHATIAGATMGDNFSRWWGGAIYNGAGAALSINASTLISNTANNGGAIQNHGTLTLTNSSVLSNSVEYRGWSGDYSMEGGGLFNTGLATVVGSSLSGNRSTYGGAVSNQEGATMSLSHVAVERNSVTNLGGGIRNAGLLTVTHSTLAYNSASQGNPAYSGGGALYNVGGAVTLLDSTVSNNATGGWSGGGILNADGEVHSTHTTIAFNQASNEGGGYWGSAMASFSAVNTLLSSNSPVDCTGLGNARYVAGNLDGDGSCGAFDTGPASLYPLQDNGGATKTHALGASSAALDAANPAYCTVTDQRDYARPPGACDVGAYEAGALPLAYHLLLPLTIR